jgi:hypothetical protein
MRRVLRLMAGDTAASVNPDDDCPHGCAAYLHQLAADDFAAADRARAHRLKKERGKALFLTRRAAGHARAYGKLRDRNRAARAA